MVHAPARRPPRPNNGLPAVPLADALAEAISAVRDEHAHTCDLDNPQTPASTVCLVRDGGDHVDYLLLCDSHLILDHQGDRELKCSPTPGSPRVADIRRIVLTGASPFGTSDHEERVRQAAQLRQQYTNQPGGYRIAAALPQAAYESLTGTLPLSGPSRLRRAALLTDGALRRGRPVRARRLARAARPAQHPRPRGTDPSGTGGGERRLHRGPATAVQAPR